MAEYDGWNRTSLLRQWWYEYAQALRRPSALGNMDRVKAVEDALSRNGWMPKHGPMHREGAEDLARDCDRLRERS